MLASKLVPHMLEVVANYTRVVAVGYMKEVEHLLPYILPWLGWLELVLCSQFPLGL